MAFQPTEVQKALKGADYPATGDELAERAEENGGSEELQDALRDIDAVSDPTEVIEQLSDQPGDD